MSDYFYTLIKDIIENNEKEEAIEIIANKLNEMQISGEKEILTNLEKDKEIERLNNIIKEVRDYIRSKSIKFTTAYVEDDGRIDLSRSDYKIDKLTSKQAKELLEILNKGE